MHKNARSAFLVPACEWIFGASRRATLRNVSRNFFTREESPRWSVLDEGRLSASATNDIEVADRVAAETGVAFGEWIVGITLSIESHLTPPLYVSLLPNESLSTSGTSEQQFHVPKRNSGTAHERAQPFSHVLDPRTGQPVRGWRSAIAIATSGARSEVLSKQLVIDPGWDLNHRALT